MKITLLISAIVCFSAVQAQDIWVNGNTTSVPPSNAVLAGIANSFQIYVGRYYHTYEGWIGASLVDRKYDMLCYYSVNGVEFLCSEFQFLTGSSGQYQWVRSVLGNIPHCGVRSNDFVGIGRGQVNGDVVIGKILPWASTMFAGYFEKEHRFESYDALTRVC